MKKIKKVLVANRGEIAARIIHSVREMKIATVAVYSQADRTAPHVQLADEAIEIGPPPSVDSYLRMDRVIEAALETGADAIHPGYGFLAENSGFATMVKKAGLIFIGPSPMAIKTMGDKLMAKAAVSKRGIPMVPGHDGPVENSDQAQKVAAKVGYPVLIKASAGGGGKGMRIVHSSSDLKGQLKRAISEASSAFGNGSVFIEKYITTPKHIEVQVMADNHGNVIHLFERECSIQRRHQKVIEEAPSPVVNDQMRNQMGAAAVEVAKACNYSGAGTVEFVVDAENNFYFLEMNTRLQVEHPVTELITGIDLVKEQIRVAQDLPLGIRQQDLRIKGHAVEARIYAEDPRNGFLPDTGHLSNYLAPNRPGIRVDDGYQQGMEIPIFYDPLISKIIAYGSNRKEAIRKLDLALADYEIGGVETTIDFCRFVLTHPEFTSGKFNTGFVDQYFTPEKLSKPTKPQEAELAAAIAGYVFQKENVTTLPQTGQNLSAWKKNRI